jgi:hypothetical protein
MSISIEKTANNIYVESEYNSDLPSKAKNLGGKWDSSNRVWCFPIEAIDEVRELYTTIYGEFDIPVETVTILCKATAPKEELHDGFTLAGIPIAYATGRDSGAKIDKRVIKLSGLFTSGGSVKNWRTVMTKDTEFKLIKVPLPVAENLVENPEWCTSIEIIKEKVAINKDELIIEKEKLLKRIAEIDTLLMKEE